MNAPTKFSGLLAAGVLCAAVRAEAADDAAGPAYAATGNVALATDYVFRGLTQTWGGPAIQGGADLAMKNGFAAGVWGSSLSEKSYPGAALEFDAYASYGRPIGDDLSWRAGLYGYFYPRGDLDHAGLRSRSFDTAEANAALTWKWLTLKYSRALTDYFGIDVEQGYRGGSEGTSYLELDAAVPLGERWALSLHAGRTDVATRLAAPPAGGAGNPDYTDVGATLKYQFAARWSLSLAATHAGNGRFYGRTSSFIGGDVRDTGGTRGFAMLQGTF